MPAILGPNGKPIAGPARPSAVPVRARYDAAQTTDDNRRLWGDADGLSARAANDPAVRRTLRNRARYERVNNSYLEGIVQTLANHTIGTGPRLQLLTDDEAFNRRYERAWASWSEAVGFAAKLRTMRMSRVVDGEAFLLLATNPKLPTAVQLDVVTVEADQVATPNLFYPTKSAVDGIEFDAYGNPDAYTVLRQHPGDTLWQAAPWEYDTVSADLMIHWFRRDRPGQCRGVPEITSAIADFSELRRFSKAVLAAAETAADFAAMLYTDASADSDTVEGTPFETMPIEKRMMVTLPAGYRAEQLKAEHPTTTYPDYERQNVNRFTRCLNMPRNIALGDSSGYNYSSGRLDHQIYYNSVRIDQHDCRLVVLNRVFRAWLAEALLVDRRSRSADVRLEDYPHQWFWDGMESIDPEKDANAAEKRIAVGVSNLSIECAREGRDYEMVLRQRAREVALMDQLGLSPAAPAPATPNQQPPGDGNAADSPPTD